VILQMHLCVLCDVEFRRELSVKLPQPNQVQARPRQQRGDGGGVTVVEDEGSAEDEAPHRREEEGAGEPTTATITILQVIPATNAVNPFTLLISVRMDDSQYRNNCNISCHRLLPAITSS
jgi:hypothetical protein